MRYLLALFLLCLPLSAQAALLEIQRVTSKNGLEAWLVEDHSVPVIAMDFAFSGAGAKLDPTDQQGLARMVSNTMDEGAGNLDSQEFQKTLQDLSITLRFGASRDHFSGSLKTLTRNKTHAFELMEMALTEPRFDAEPVTRMKRANQSRIRSALSDPDWIAARVHNDQLFGKHPYAQNSGGTLSSLEAITPDDLRRFQQNYLAKDNLKIAVAGDITAKELAKVLDQIFGDLPAKAALPDTQYPEITINNQTTLYEMDIPQTIIQMTQKGIARKSPDYQTAQVMNFILGSSGFGSRLTKEIREKRGLTYGIYTSFDHLEDFEGLNISTSTKNESAAEMLSQIRKEWTRMKDDPVTDEELRDAVSYLTGALPLSLTSTDKISGLMLSLQLDDLSMDYLDRRDAKLRSITIEDVESLAQNLLDPNNMSVVLVGKPEGIKPDITVETLPNVE